MLIRATACQLTPPRFALHVGRSNTSTTVSTVSSPTTSLGRFPTLEQIVPAPTQLRSSSVAAFSPSRRAGKPAQHSRFTLETPSEPAPSPPLLFASKSLPPPSARTQPLPSTRIQLPPSTHIQPLPSIRTQAPPSTWIEILPDSDDEVVVHTQPPAGRCDSVDWTAELGAESHVLSTLPLVLAEIKPEESKLSLHGTGISFHLPL